MTITEERIRVLLRVFTAALTASVDELKATLSSVQEGCVSMLQRIVNLELSANYTEAGCRKLQSNMSKLGAKFNELVDSVNNLMPRLE